MSVPEGQRKEGRFTLLIKAEELARYTIVITANEKVFLPMYQRALTDKINSYAIDIYTKLRTANEIEVHELGDWEERDKLQKQAADCCNNLLALIDIAKRVFHLNSKRVKYWGTMIVEVRNRIRAWNRSDERRYSY